MLCIAVCLHVNFILIVLFFSINVNEVHGRICIYDSGYVVEIHSAEKFSLSVGWADPDQLPCLKVVGLCDKL